MALQAPRALPAARRVDRAPAARRARAAAPRAARAGGDVEPGLDPVLGAVNRATIAMAANPTVNRVKMGFWGLFAGREAEGRGRRRGGRAAVGRLGGRGPAHDPILPPRPSLYRNLRRGRGCGRAGGAHQVGARRRVHVVVFPLSKKACQLLDGLGARYTTVELDKVPRGFALKKELSKATDRSSVPHVFIRGESVGGCFDGPGLVPLYQSGELQKMLKRARAL